MFSCVVFNRLTVLCILTCILFANMFSHFLLRLWADEDETTVHWRASMQEVPDGKRVGFGDLVDLLIFLESLIPPKSQHSTNRAKMFE